MPYAQLIGYYLPRDDAPGSVVGVTTVALDLGALWESDETAVRAVADAVLASYRDTHPAPPLGSAAGGTYEEISLDRTGATVRVREFTEPPA